MTSSTGWQIMTRYMRRRKSVTKIALLASQTLIWRERQTLSPGFYRHKIGALSFFPPG